MSLQQTYKEKIKTDLIKELKINPMQAPAVRKIVVNTGIGPFARDKNAVEQVVKTIEQITGQKAIVTKAKKSIAAFKIRDGMPVGVKTTLRGKRMYDFLDKIINITLPRIRDFQGINASSIDQRGNLTIGIKDVSVFPEISKKDLHVQFGLEVTLTVNADTPEQGKALFEALGLPFRK